MAGGDYSLPRAQKVLHQMPTSATTAPSPCRTTVAVPEPLYSKIDPQKKRPRCNNRAADVDNGEEFDSEPKSWMPLLVSRNQQESTL